MTTSRSIVAAIGFFFGSATLLAADTQAVRGLGIARCEQLIAWNANNIDTSEVISWLYGHWSAENITRHNSGQEMKNIMHHSVAPAALLAQLLSFCRERPTAIIAAAGNDIFLRLPDAVE